MVPGTRKKNISTINEAYPVKNFIEPNKIVIIFSTFIAISLEMNSSALFFFCFISYSSTL